MPERRHLLTAHCVAFFALAFAPAVDAAPLVIKPAATVDASKLRADAEAAEKAGKWDRALELYLEAYLAGNLTPELRDRIRVCFRNLSQVQRYRDPSFQRFVLSLPPADALNLYAEALGKIQTAYAEREKATPDKLFALGLDELERALADASFRKAYCPDAADLKLHKFRIALKDGYRSKLPTTPRDARHAAREIVAAAQAQLGLNNSSAAVLELLCGACGSLDEFSGFVPPADGSGDVTSPLFQLAAYGILVAFDDRGILIDGIAPGSWAASNTYLQRGQRISRINDKPMEGATLATLGAALKTSPSSAGHEIETTAFDDDAPAADYRLPMPVPTVYGVDMLKDGIGFIRIGAFREGTPRELDDAVDALKVRGLRALILDIRGNAGGSLPASLAAAQRFLPTGIIVGTRGQTPDFSERIFSSDAGMAAHDFPLVLLVDTKTMSAAEIFAAGMKDNNRATLIGQRTFGKGLIQTRVRLQTLDAGETDRSGYLLLSVGTAYTPRGVAINNEGIAPHIPAAEAQKQLSEAIRRAVEQLNGLPVGMR